ncbi:MAG: extracellular solute-binding protein [Anaerolineae bacterium]|jgi:ABC-type glycerol-3-phosphate transport system substrate-binding protein
MVRKSLSRRRFLQSLGVTAGAAALAACAGATQQPAAPAGGEAAATSAPPAAPAGGVTLRYRSWHSPDQSLGDAAWYDWLAENYAAEREGAKIEYEYVAFGSEYIQKVLADSAAGTPPDVLHSSIIWARDFYDRGVLLDLNDYIDAVPELAEDQFLGTSTTAYRSKDGKFYGVPWEGPDSGVIGVNSNILREAGFDPKGADIQTWDDLVRVAKACTVKEGNEITQAGILVDSFRYIESFAAWLRSNGGEMHNDAITEPTFNTDAAAEVLEVNLELLETCSFPISPDRQDTQIFMQGQAALAYAGTWSTTTFDDQAPEGFEYWLIPYPKGPSGTSAAVITWSNMFVIPRQVKNPDAAFDLMAYCTTPPVVITRFELSTRTTPHRAIFETDAWQEQVALHPALAVKPEVAELGGVYPYFPFYTEANDAIGTELEYVMLGQKSVKEGLAQAEQNVRDVIARRTSA